MKKVLITLACIASFTSGIYYQKSLDEKRTEELISMYSNSKNYWDGVSLRSLDLLYAMYQVDTTWFRNEYVDLPEFIDLENYMYENGDEPLECFIGEYTKLLKLPKLSFLV